MSPIIWFILVYAVLVLAGGIVGYVKAESKASLISGVASGVALAIAWYIAGQTPAIGLPLAAALALVLLIVFAIRFRKTGKFMPAGLMAALSLAATLLFFSGWIVGS
jgi:uncharacterized membrane protein (UPF0136 family)